MGPGAVNSIPVSAQRLLLSLSQLWVKKGEKGTEEARESLRRYDIISIRWTNVCGAPTLLGLGSRGKIKQMWFLTSWSL